MATQPTTSVYVDTAPMGMRNMAKKRAPVEVDAVAMTLPAVASIIRQKMWMERSLYRAAVQLTKTATMNVANHAGGSQQGNVPRATNIDGDLPGTVRSKVIRLSYPKVCTMLGKKYWNVIERMLRCVNKTKM